MKILVINGPNLNLLSIRDAGLYGAFTLKQIEENMIQEFPEHEFSFIQSNNEGALVTTIQGAHNTFDGLIINPCGFAHTSIAIRDALELCQIPKIEVHLSKVHAREHFRNVMLTSQKCDGYIAGLKENGYSLAVAAIQKMTGKAER